MVAFINNPSLELHVYWQVDLTPITRRDLGIFQECVIAKVQDVVEKALASRAQDPVEDVIQKPQPPFEHAPDDGELGDDEDEESDCFVSNWYKLQCCVV